MKMFLVAIFDKRAREYSPPQSYVTLGVAERALTDAVNSPDSHLNKHPEDYSMHVIGEYESTTGITTARPGGPEPLIDAIQLLNDKDTR